MKPLYTTVHVGADAVLHMRLPSNMANAEVEVTVVARAPSANGKAIPASPEEWAGFVRETAGAWEGEFERPPQGPPERRGDWP